MDLIRNRRMRIWLKPGYIVTVVAIVLSCGCGTSYKKSSSGQLPPPEASKVSQKTETNSTSKIKELLKPRNLEQQVIKLYEQGRYADAIPIAEEILMTQEKAFGPEDPDVALSLEILAMLYAALEEYTKAEPLYQQALMIYEKILGSEHLDVATTLISLAKMYDSQGEHAKAEPLYQRALAIREKLKHPPEQQTSEETTGPEMLSVPTESELAEVENLSQQVVTLIEQARYRDAIPAAERVLSILEKTFGPEHPHIAPALSVLGGLYKSLGDYTRAEPFYQRTLAIREQGLGPEHPDVAQSLNDLAELYLSWGEYVKAELSLKRALTISEKVFDPEHPDVAQSLNNLASFYYSLGEYTKAEPLFRRALTIREQALGPEHPYVAVSLNNLAVLYKSCGKYAKAEPLHQRALAIRKKSLGLKHPDVANSLNNLAELYFFRGEYAKAEPLYQQAQGILEKVLGPEHPDTAINLNNLAMLYQAMGTYGKAEPLYQRTLAILEKGLGPEHPNTATSLNNLAMLYQTMGTYGKAELLYQRALAIREKTLGSEHPDVAITLNNLAELYRTMGAYTLAEPLYQRAMTINEEALGDEHPAVAASLNNLALLYQTMGMYAQAEPLYQRALAINEKALGPEHPSVAIDLNNLAELYWNMGLYAQAEPLYQQTLSILEKVLGSEHPDTATSLNNLARLYQTMGAYGKAEPLYRQALAIQEQVLGSEHPGTATSLNNLAGLYVAMGVYARAEPLYRQALAIREKILGPEHPDTAANLNNLAMLYGTIRAYARAEPLYQQALSILEKGLGPEHPATAASLNNLADLYCGMGTYAQAGPLYRRALAIREKVLGPEHSDTAISLNNLAGLYQIMGAYAQAEPLYQQALVILEKVLGPEHPDTAISLNNLALLYQAMGAYAKAEPLSQRALAVVEKTLGPEHPNTATSLNSLAMLHTALDRTDQAYPLFLRAQQIHAQLIEQVMGFTSERQKLDFLAMVSGQLHAFLSLVNQQLVWHPSARKDALDVWLRRKGVILEAQKRFQEALVYSDNPEAVTTFQELARVRAQLSRLVFAGPEKEGPDAYKKRIDELEAKKEELEAKLSRLSQAYAMKQKIAKADVEKVAQTLPKNTVLLDFARVDIFNFKAKGQEEKWQPAHYLAFILHAGDGDKVGMIDLGEADTIDRSVAAFKKQIARGRVEKRSFDALTSSSEQVYNLVFEPLQEELGEMKEIFISPDGNLNLLPFEVLIGPDGRFLIEEYTFNYLAAGRDILGFGEIQEEGNSPLLMGDPDFDLDLSPPPDLPHQGGGAKPTPDPSQEGNERRSVDMRGFHFKRLPWTKKEVETIHTLLGESLSPSPSPSHPFDIAQDRQERGTSSPPPNLPHQGGGTMLYIGKEAIEEVLLQSEAPRILHLATHGFFLEDQDWQAFAQDTFSRRAVISLKPPGSQDFVWTPSVPSPPGKFENPLLRSGIALAGANTVTGEEGQTSGIVTAEKILGLKLRGTEMVVLSACETGLGDVQAGEGVFGLRRAFTQAGAKSLVMSLWAVPDKETQELMVQFYTNIFSGNMTRCQALRQAALLQMEIVKDRYGYPHPLYWGAFVFMGEP